MGISVHNAFEALKAWYAQRDCAGSCRREWGFIALNSVLFLCLVLSGFDLLWCVILTLWANSLLYTVRGRDAHVFLVLFLLAYFFLLMSRDTMHRVFGYAADEGINSIEGQYVVLLGLIGILVGYFLLPRIGQALRSVARVAIFPSAEGEAVKRHFFPEPFIKIPGFCTVQRIQQAAIYLMVLIFPLALMGVARTIFLVSASSYQTLFTQDFAAAYNSGPIFTISFYSRRALMVIYAVYLATQPSKTSFIRWTGVVSLSPLLLIIAGVRAELTLLIILVLGYIFTRQYLNKEEKWVSRRLRFQGVIAGIVLLAGFSALERLRGVGSSRGLADFLYNQGVTARVIENVVLFRDQLPKQFYLAEFAHSGIFARLFGLESFRGASLERAQEGGSLSHSLSLLVLGEERYLAGQGTGSSFIAEGYVQWGLWGVLLVACVYGGLIAWVDSCGHGRIVSDALKLVALPSMVWSIRGSATGFITAWTQPASLLAFVLLAGMLLVLARFPIVSSQFLRLPVLWRS